MKASEGSLMVDATANAGSIEFDIVVIKRGWINGVSCQLTCDKTVYQYAVLTVDAPGEYDCYGSKLWISAILVLLVLLF